MTLIHRPDIKGRPKMRFENAVVREEGPILCARLAADRSEDSTFDYSSERLSISAIVRKKDDAPICQDAAIVFISERIAAIGAFDGYKDAGTILSEKMADIFLSLLKSGMRGNLFYPGFDLLSSMDLPREARAAGGTTATLAILYPDGGIYVTGAGDSPAYRIRDGFAERVLEYRYGPKKRPVSQMSVEEYLATRNLVSNPVDLFRFNASKVMGYGGIMNAPGESVLVATDGLTKNLKVLLDPATNAVTDCSGNVHLSGIVRGRQSTAAIVRAIDSAVIESWQSPYEIDPSGWALSPVEDDFTAVMATLHRLESDS
ncbi:MAG TPA: PP2C family serine/threonine-protein phosphatase [Candidatus Bilamarchaeum sp.]|nr:PP2C family serine/threonine-protein phosphatase [Candidatus Bilamarchaeum sp.]